MGYLATAISRADHQVEAYRAAAASAMDSGGGRNPIVEAGGGRGYDSLIHAQRLARNTEQYKHNTGWVYVAIDRIATRLSGQPVCLGRKLSPGKAEVGRKWRKQHGWDGAAAKWRLAYGTTLLAPWRRERAPAHIKESPYDYELIEQHSFLDALDYPNELMVRATLFISTATSLGLTGRGYWWAPTVKGKQQLWPLPTDWVTPRHTETELYIGYDVQPPGKPGEPVPVPASEMISFMRPDASDPFRAVSPVQTQAPAIVADEAIQTAQHRTFQNGIFPGIMLTVGRTPDVDGKPGVRPILTREQRKDLIEAARAIYEGTVNYHEPLIIDGLIEDAKPFTRTPQEMDFLNSGIQTKSRIMQAFGVNPFIAGENVTVGWSQASVADEVFVANVVNPLGTMMGQSVTKHLDDPALVFWVEEATPRDPELKLKRFSVALNRGACWIDEFRQEVLGLPPMENGEGQRPASRPSGGPPRPDEEGDEAGRTDDEGRPVRPTPPRRQPQALGHLLPRLRRAAEGIFVKQYESHEAELRRALRPFFRQMGEAVEAEFTATPDAPPETLYRPEEWRAPLRATVFKPLVRAMVAGYMAEKALLEERLPSVRTTTKEAEAGEPHALAAMTEEEIAWIGTWDLPRPVRDGITRNIAETLARPYWQTILETTGADVRHTLKHGLDEGWSTQKIGKALSQEVGDELGKRGKRIANTEITNAINAGHDVQAAEVEQMGLSVIKIWVTVGDNDVRHAHQQMELRDELREVKGADGLFNLQGWMIPYPGHWSLPAELRINCRCTFFTDLEELRPVTALPEPGEPEGAAFTPAETVEEAGKWMADNLVEEKVRGFSNVGDVDMANHINETLWNHKKKYGQMFRSISFKKLPDSVAAQVTPHNVLELNKRVWESKEWFATWQARSPAGYFADPSSKGLLTHEFGHLLNDKWEAVDYARRTSTLRVFTQWDTAKPHVGRLSRYAEVNSDEMVAEAFAKFEAQGTLAGTGVEKLEKVFTKWGKS